MIDKIKKELCTGCNSCYNACQEDAITMIVDYEGFWYPEVNDDLCTRCGQCVLKCPSINSYTPGNRLDVPEIYGGWSKDEKIRISSTSGGAFTEIAKACLLNGGFVVGAQYTQDFMVEHTIISSDIKMKKLRQSKYVQSQISNIYKSIKSLLLQEKEVLFCGTPCQNAGLSKFLGQEYLNLTKIDFICRGVISPMVFEKYLEMLVEKYNSPISKVNFKNKTNGWNGFGTLVEFENGKTYLENRYEDIYMLGYLKYNLYMRPSCHHCLYKELPRLSDITLGDFWSIGKTRPYLDDNKGTSVIMINSKKGSQIFEKVKQSLFYEACTLEEVIKGNGCLLESIPEGIHRDDFFRYIQNESFREALLHVIMSR